MKKIGEAMGKDETLSIAISSSITNNRSFISKEIIECLEDPTENPTVAEMIKNIYRNNKFEGEEVDVKYGKKIRETMDRLLGDEIKKQIGIEDDE